MSDPNQSENSHVEIYGDDAIESLDAPVPAWLKFNYILWPLWGIVWFYFFFNGSYGWLDRGYWFQLERAANTTFPTTKKDWPEELNQGTENKKI